MRQAGILAAAGIVALETMTGRLLQDHARAQKLADGLKQVPGLVLDPGTPATNMVFLSLRPEIISTTEEVFHGLKERGVLIDTAGERYFRLVTHFWIDDTMVEKTIIAFRDMLQ